MPKTPTKTSSPSGGEVYLVPVGVPIEKCPVCGARVCRGVLNPGAKTLIYVLLTLPERFEFPDTWAAPHRCSRALEILNAERDRLRDVRFSAPNPTQGEDEASVSEPVASIGYKLPISNPEE